LAVYNRAIDIIGSMAVHNSLGRAIDLIAADAGKQLSVIGE
jgi:hypothetical protein